MHKSYSHSTREHYSDKFNIDYIRYMNTKNLLYNIIGTLIGCLFYFMGWAKYFGSNKAIILPLYFGGALFFFLMISFISHKAGNKWHECYRLAGRRGLFSYSIITLVVITVIIITGVVSLSDTFGRFIYVLLSLQITGSLFAVPLDLGSTFSRKE